MTAVDPSDHDQVIGIVVLYNPPEDIGAQLQLMESGGIPIIAVYNAFDARRLEDLRKHTSAQFICFDKNRGLAEAFNAGIDAARARGARAVMLLDQDSRPDAAMASRLIEIETLAEREGLKVAAVGPATVDVKGAQAALTQSDGRSWHEVETIISSGSLIPLTAIDAVGPMWEQLFIDHIDHEWCLRARAAGWSIVQADDVLMPHNLGDVGIVLFGHFKGIHRSPIRHYHILRNTIVLLRVTGISKTWRFTEAIKTLYRLPVYLAASTNRWETLKAFVKAIRDHRLVWQSRPNIWN